MAKQEFVFNHCRRCAAVDSCYPLVEYYVEDSDYPIIEQEGPYCLEPSCGVGPVEANEDE